LGQNHPYNNDLKVHSTINNQSLLLQRNTEQYEYIWHFMINCTTFFTISDMKDGLKHSKNFHYLCVCIHTQVMKIFFITTYIWSQIPTSHSTAWQQPIPTSYNILSHFCNWPHYSTQILYIQFWFCNFLHTRTFHDRWPGDAPSCSMLDCCLKLMLYLETGL
jgi:hypothetical protein